LPLNLLHDQNELLPAAAQALLNPTRRFCRSEVLVKDCPVPREPGVYGWYFRGLPVPTSNCHWVDDTCLAYVGIAPRAPAVNGQRPSRQSLRSRIRYHFRGNASASTLRFTLGVLLQEALGIRLQRAGSGTRLSFGTEGEQRLSEWMQENAFVTWAICESQWEVEDACLRALDLPLNLAGNQHNGHHAVLRALRASARRAALV